MLRISLTDNSPITVSVDGRYFSTRGTVVNVGDIPWGWHFLKIFQNDQRNGQGVVHTLYEGRVRTYRGQVTYFTLDPYSGRTVSSAEDLTDWEARKNNTTAQQPAVDTNTNYVPPLPYDQQMQPTVPPNDSIYTPAPLPDGVPAASPVNLDNKSTKTTKGKATSFSKLATKVKSLPTDTERLEAAKTGLKDKKLTSQNVVQAMGWFNFENSRLEFAKWAYSRTTDPANYKTVVAALQITANKKELQDFIAKSK